MALLALADQQRPNFFLEVLETGRLIGRAPLSLLRLGTN